MMGFWLMSVVMVINMKDKECKEKDFAKQPRRRKNDNNDPEMSQSSHRWI